MRLRCWIALLLVSLLAGGCSLSLQMPVPPADPVLELHAPFLGTWSLDQLAGQIPDQPIEIQVSLDAEQNLVVELMGPQPLTRKAHLSQIAGLLFGFVEDEASGRWSFAQLELDGPGQTLTVKGIDLARVRQDIDSGALSGRVFEARVDRPDLEIEADSAELVAYITANPTILAGDAAVLSKVE